MRTPGILKNEHQKDDQLLCAIAQNRDITAFEELFNRYSKSGFTLALRILRNRAAAEDAFQEGMLQIWASATNFDPEGNAKGWILRIIARKCLNVIRKQKRGKRMEALDAQQDGVALTSCHESLPEAADLRARLHREVNALTPADQRLVALYYGGSLSHREIGAQLGIPTRSVSKRLATIRDGLNHKLVRAGYASTGVVTILEAAVLAPLFVPQGLWGGMARKLDAPVMLEKADTHSMTMRYGVGIVCLGLFMAGAVVAMTFSGASDRNGLAVEELKSSASSVSANHPPGDNVRPAQWVPKKKLWNFDSKKECKDFFTIKGSYKYLSGQGTGNSGILRLGAEPTNITINFTDYTLPLLMKIYFRTMKGEKSSRLTVSWNRCHFVATLRGRFKSAWNYGEPGLITVYISKNGFDVRRGDKRVGYHYALPMPDRGPRFPAISGFKFDIDRLSIQEIKPDQVPDCSSLRALVDRIPMDSPEGELSIPNMKPAPGKKNVFLNYVRIPVDAQALMKFGRR